MLSPKGCRGLPAGVWGHPLNPANGRPPLGTLLRLMRIESVSGSPDPYRLGQSLLLCQTVRQWLEWAYSREEVVRVILIACVDLDMLNPPIDDLICRALVDRECQAVDGFLCMRMMGVDSAILTELFDADDVDLET